MPLIETKSTITVPICYFTSPHSGDSLEGRLALYRAINDYEREAFVHFGLEVSTVTIDFWLEEDELEIPTWMAKVVFTMRVKILVHQ